MMIADKINPPINQLKDEIDTKVIRLVLLSIVTAGIYPIIWLSNNFKIIDRVTKKKTATNNYIICMAACYGIGDVLSINSFGGVMDRISTILSIVFSVLFVVWAFRAKKALQEYCLDEYRMDLRFNDSYIVIFNIYYVVYCINNLADVQRRENIVGKGIDS